MAAGDQTMVLNTQISGAVMEIGTIVLNGTTPVAYQSKLRKVSAAFTQQIDGTGVVQAAVNKNAVGSAANGMVRLVSNQAGDASKTVQVMLYGD